MNDYLSDLETLSHAIPLAKRKELGEVFNRLSCALGLQQEQITHLTWPSPAWPKRGESGLTRDNDLRYLVDFSYSDPPDHRDYLATFEEVRALLRYTPGSCKVAFGTGKGKVDRSRRPTRLGACVIFRLPTKVDASKYPQAQRLKDREAELFAPRLDARGRPTRLRGNKY